ncbi:hypothetical protein B0H11DRAFT_2255985 [Mycena galericulata]|nr:hypothetical protein B0H11DRAFT_2255985 [Mycena galericulata]
MQSLSIDTPMGQGWEAATHSAAVFSAIMRCIAARWATTLRHLNILRIAGSHDDLAPQEGVTGLQSVSLKHVLHEPLSDVRVLSVIRAWINLRSLEIDGPGAERTLRFCDASRNTVPRSARSALRTPPRHLPRSIGDTWNRTKITRLAQYFDHFFPDLVIIRGEGHLWWEEVEQLAFEYQDMRHRIAEANGNGTKLEWKCSRFKFTLRSPRHPLDARRLFCVVDLSPTTRRRALHAKMYNAQHIAGGARTPRRLDIDPSSFALHADSIPLRQA